MAAKPKFTRIPKTSALLQAGVPTEAISTYCCLTDYANNKTGLCWPKMETLAQTLNRSVRTVQRHLHLLREVGVIEFVERRRHKGRFSSYLYRVLHIVQTTGHGKRVAGERSNKRRTKHTTNTPKSPEKDVKEGYWWFFGEEAPPGKQEEYQRRQQAKQQVASTQQTDRYDWFFQ